MAGYDRAITVFSPDGHLFQVEYAMEAVRKGSTVVGVVGKDCIVLAAEGKKKTKLQVKEVGQKILKLDTGLHCAFAGLQADARVLLNRVRVECQSQYLRLNEAATTEEVAAYISSIQQRYTVKGGRRPFGLSLILAGFSATGPEIFVCNPSGVYTKWKAAVIGKNDKNVKEFLEKHYEEDATSEDATVEIAVRALSEFVEALKSCQVVVIRRDSTRVIDEETIGELEKKFEAEKVKPAAEEA